MLNFDMTLFDTQIPNSSKATFTAKLKQNTDSLFSYLLESKNAVLLFSPSEKIEQKPVTKKLASTKVQKWSMWVSKAPNYYFLSRLTKLLEWERLILFSLFFLPYFWPNEFVFKHHFTFYMICVFLLLTVMIHWFCHKKSCTGLHYSEMLF